MHRHCPLGVYLYLCLMSSHGMQRLPLRCVVRVILFIIVVSLPFIVRTLGPTLHAGCTGRWLT